MKFLHVTHSLVSLTIESGSPEQVQMTFLTKDTLVWLHCKQMWNKTHYLCCITVVKRLLHAFALFEGLSAFYGQGFKDISDGFLQKKA